MRYLIIALLGVALITGCRKHKSATDSDTAVESFEPTKQYDVKFISPSQQVTVTKYKDGSGTVHDSILTMTYYEKTALIARTLDYNQSWSLYFNQSYKGTALDSTLFTTTNATGQYVYNWIETNLNNVVLQSKSDTLINGTNYYNLKLSRVITFFKAYNTPAAATQALNAIVLRKNDAVSFSTYYSSAGQNSVPATSSASLVYIKQ